MEEGNLTKEQAIDACINEHKRIAHRYFGIHEWVEFRNGSFYTEDGYNMGGLNDEFWRIRSGGFWEYDWRIIN